MTDNPALALILTDTDTVATALSDIAKGATVLIQDKKGKVSTLSVLDEIPFGHKIATITMKKGDPVMKYGESLGIASQNIQAGQHVHTQNVESEYGRGDLGRRDASAHGNRGARPRTNVENTAGE